MLVHGEAKDGRETPEYLAWLYMRSRCSSPSYHGRKYYTGKNLTVGEEFCGTHGYINFLREVGRKPSSVHSLDRINNSLGYVSGNLRWATKSEQMSNRDNTIRITFRGKTQSLGSWARELSIPRTTAYRLIGKGMDPTVVFDRLMEKRCRGNSGREKS